jgi:hypothetical protein
LRPRDYIPLALLGGVVVLIAVQGSRMGKERVRNAARPAADSAPDTTSPAAPQDPATPEGTATPQGTVTTHGSVTTPSAPTGAVASRNAAPRRDLATIQERIREGAPGTYLLHMLEEQDHQLARWPDRRAEPLRVWIQPTASIPDWNVTYPVVAERAFDEWRDAGFPIRFDMIRDSVATDIKILFVHQMPPEDSSRIGVARRMMDEHGWIVSAEIIIATHDREGRPLPAAMVAGSARHEVGHILGLGHSNNPGDVMFPESRTPIISASDRATLHMIYILPPGPVR